METTKNNSSIQDQKKFKSYYVVWKLSVEPNDFCPFVLFKSYYVVWKQMKNKKKARQRNGLNRTM